MDHKDIVAVAAKLNESGKLSTPLKVVAVKTEVITASFIEACAAIPMADLLAIGDDVVAAFVQIVGTSGNFDSLADPIKNLYNTLPDRFFDAPAEGDAAPAEAAPAPTAEAAPVIETPTPTGDGSLGTTETPPTTSPQAPKEPKKPGEKGYRSDCRDYGKKPDDNSGLCQSCKQAKAAEYEACHKIVADKAAKKAAKGTGERKPPVFTKNVLGHRVGAMNDFIDQALLAGPAYQDVIVAGLVEKFGKDAAHALAKCNSHTRTLCNEGHTVTKTTEGEGDAKRLKYTLTVKAAEAPAAPAA